MSTAEEQAALTKLYSDYHQYSGAIVAEITVLICFLESYQRIQNKHLKVSISLFFVFSILVNVLFLTGTALFAAGNVAVASPMIIMGSISWVIAWLNVTYHTSYRAALISMVGYQRPWLIALVAVLCQGALSGTGSVFFTLNYLKSFGNTVDPRSTTITYVESFWYSIVETALFVITQYRIVSVRARVKKVSTMTKIELYWKAVSRSILYSLNVVMMFLSVGNAFGAGVGANWSLYGHSMTLLILMTDSNRFQETIAILNGDTSGGGKKSGTAGFTYGSQNGVSGNNHSISDHKGYEIPAPRSQNNARQQQQGGAIRFNDQYPEVGGQYESNGVFGTGGAAGQLYPPTGGNYNGGYNDGSTRGQYGTTVNGAMQNTGYSNYQAGSQYGGSQPGQNYGGQGGRY
ncbi:hypothetical protein BJ742DRAFT_834837 [Cladochytrium replicatum]|nr:hypothetical protein BJ742DRAFT_834837 [Cladochytrium replicatum]